MIKSLKADRLLLVYFGFLCLFPTLRYLLIGRHTASGLEYLISAIPDLFSFAIIGLFTFSYLKKNGQLKLTTIDYLYSAYILFSILYGTILSGDKMAIVLGFRLSYLPMLFYFVGRFNLVEKEEFIPKYIRPIFHLFGYVAIIGFVLYFFIPKYNLEIIEKIDGVVNQYLIVRMTSIFWTPVVFGTTMGISLLYFIYQYFNSDKLTKIEWVFIVFCWFGLILSVSRGPIICFIISLLLVIVMAKNFNKTWRILLLLSGFYVLCILLASVQQQMLYNGGTFLSLFYNMINFTVKSAASTITMEESLTRVELWRRSWISFTEQPWGYGLGKSGHIAWRLFKDTTTPSSPYSTDGWYLKLLGETGIPGALFFTGLLSFFTLQIRKYQLLTIDSSTSFIILLLLFILVQNIVSNVFDYYCIASFTFILLGHLSNYFRYDKA